MTKFIFLDKNSAVWLFSGRVRVCLTFYKTARLFSKDCSIFHLQQNRLREAVAERVANNWYIKKYKMIFYLTSWTKESHKVYLEKNYSTESKHCERRKYMIHSYAKFCFNWSPKLTCNLAVWKFIHYFLY